MAMFDADTYLKSNTISIYQIRKIIFKTEYINYGYKDHKENDAKWTEQNEEENKVPCWNLDIVLI